ncbi:MAG: hypothetical protein AAGD01_03345 [Acidobacteriota bacterium]
MKVLEYLQFLFIGPVIVLFLAVLNYMVSPGVWWFQFAALGIGIAWVICFVRVVAAALLAGGVAALAAVIYQRSQA